MTTSLDPRTSRLDAERPSLERHLDFLTELFADERVARWHWPELGGPRNAEESRNYLVEAIEHWSDHGYGLWLWRDRAFGGLVARVGLHRVTVEDEPVVEVGWTVPTGLQGRGYATQAAIRSLRFAFHEASLEEVVSFTWTENAPSLRVMEKAGLAYERAFQHADLPHLLYVAHAGDWAPPPGD